MKMKPEVGGQQVFPKNAGAAAPEDELLGPVATLGVAKLRKLKTPTAIAIELQGWPQAAIHASSPLFARTRRGSQMNFSRDVKAAKAEQRQRRAGLTILSPVNAARARYHLKHERHPE
jgi:hypothetical protein